MARKITYFFLGLLALLLLTAFLIPFFINLDNYKGEISDKVKEATGRELSLQGPIHLSLLPSPTVTIEHAQLSNPKGAKKSTMLSLEKVKIDIALFPLLKKKLQVTNIHLLSPSLHLEKYSDGSNNWSFSPTSQVEKNPTNEESSPTENPLSMSFDHIEMINAHIYFHDGDTHHEVTNLTTRLKVGDLKGPLSADGFFKLNNQDIRFDLKVKEIAEKIPLQLELDSMGVEVTLKGDFHQDGGSFRGDLKVAGDTKSVEKASQGDVSLPHFMGDALSLSGYVIANKEALELQNLTLKADQETLTGNVSIRLTPLTFSGALRGFPGRLVIELSGKPESDGLQGDLDFSLASPKDLFVWMNQEWPQKLPNSRISLKTSFKQKGDVFSVSGLEARFNQTMMTGSGSFNEKTGGVSYSLKSQNLGNVLSPFVGDLPVNLSTLDMSGNSTLNLQKESLTTKSSLSLPGGTLRLEGSILYAQKSLPTFNLDTVLSITEGARLLNKSVPFKSLDLKASLAQKDKVFSAQSIQGAITIGTEKVTLTGETSLAFAKKPKLTGALSLGGLNLSPILATLSSSSKESLDQSQVPASQAKTTKDEGVWSSDAIDLSSLKLFDAELRFKAAHVSFQDHVLKDLSATVSLENGFLQIPALTGEVYGGKANVNIALSGGPSSTLKLKGSIDDLLLNRALSKLQDEDIRIVKGELDGAIDMATTGNSLRSFVENLEGFVTLNATKGLVDGFDLKKVSQRLKNLNTLEAFLSLFKTAMSTGQTSFSDFSLAMTFKKGVGHLTKLILVADGGEGNGSGTVDLPKYNMAISTNFRLTDHEKLPPFEMTFEGPLNNPQKKFDTSALENYLMTNVFKKLIGGVVTGGPVGVVISDVLGKMTGGNSQSDSSSSKEGTNADQAVNDNAKTQEGEANPVEKVIEAPAKAVGDLLKGLF